MPSEYMFLYHRNNVSILFHVQLFLCLKYFISFFPLLRHAQILATLKAFCHWLTQYSKINSQYMEKNSENSIAKIIADIAIANVKKKVFFLFWVLLCQNVLNKSVIV